MHNDPKKPRTIQFADESNVTSSAEVRRVSDPLCGSGSFLLAGISGTDEVERITDAPVERLESTENRI